MLNNWIFTYLASLSTRMNQLSTNVMSAAKHNRVIHKLCVLQMPSKYIEQVARICVSRMIRDSDIRTSERWAGGWMRYTTHTIPTSRALLLPKNRFRLFGLLCCSKATSKNSNEKRVGNLILNSKKINMPSVKYKLTGVNSFCLRVLHWPFLCFPE